MADEADCSQVISERYLQGALAAVLDRAAWSGAESRQNCIDCGISIPEARRKAVPGCKRCVMCQAKIERKQLSAGYKKKEV